jgi:hypothetical protein
VVIPTTQYGVGVFLILVLPGIVYAAVRTGASGMRSQDRDVAARVLQALLVSVLLDTTYLLLLGHRPFGCSITPTNMPSVTHAKRR